ncbi:ATP-dependent DNA helicase MPH1 [Paramyrothecium foliicola]|nr:ATP-dependent DNA helicase MPH1 [Paramyrothecium foliicola]
MDDDEFCDAIDDDLLEALTGHPTSSTPSARNSQAPHTIAGTRMRHDATGLAGLELEGLSDAFSSADEAVRGQQAPLASKTAAAPVPELRTSFARSNSGILRQAILWGGEVSLAPPRPSQPMNGRGYRADQPREPPSHHALDEEAMKTWVYPTNLGVTRDYQFNIVRNSLFNNTLVALPTGLGKTFIAATVMLNYYRWAKSAKIVFVAPTKPLVAQQVDACYNIAGIPRSETTLLTGDIQPALRVDEWEKRRVFFMTPQTLLNDLSHGYADPKSIVLLVIDEAHRAVGEYAYAKVAKLIRRFSNSIRILALTATPGSKVETVQEIIDNLGIAHCEIRTEESMDIRQYVHHRNVDQVVLDPSDEMITISELFTKALKPLTDKLSSQNIWYGRSPMAMTAYGLMQAQREWFNSRGRQTNQGIQFMMRAIFSVLTSIAHSIKLLNYHGIKPFYDNLVDLRSEQEGKGEKGSKYKRQLITDSNFQEMMDNIAAWMKKDDFVGHPKLTALADCILNHFMDNEESTRVIVFSEFRDSADEIVRMLNTHKPLIKASVFVGQADSKRGEGMKQAQQIKTIEDFRKGAFNVLVATSIGEEGLDIGQVDLIVCYDASASPIRMLQRMGRTGRKRAGNIVLLLMRGREEDQFAKSKDNYEKMQQLICEGSRFNFRFDLSTRIVPREIRPEVDQRPVDIPVENTQDQSLPEPKKRRGAPLKKKPPKKFHMPDGVETGFQKVTDLIRPKVAAGKQKPQRNPELDDLAHIPDLERVVLSAEELKELDRSYRDLPFNHSVVEETDMPSLSSYPELQRELRPTADLRHGRHTKRVVRLLKSMSLHADDLVRPCRSLDDSNYVEIPVHEFVDSDGESPYSDATGLGDGGKKRPAAKNNAEFMDAECPSRATKTAKKRKTVARKTSASRQPTNKAVNLVDEEPDDSDDDGDSDDAIPQGSKRKLSTNPRRGKGQRKKRPRQSRGGGINSDEIGDDCERDSDLLESSDSDDGEDLADFLVSDNHVTSSMQHPPSSTPSIASESPSTPRAPQEKPFYVPTQFPGTQESEGMPDLDTLANTKQTGRREAGKPVRRASNATRRGRQVVDDSDDEM